MKTYPLDDLTTVETSEYVVRVYHPVSQFYICTLTIFDTSKLLMTHGDKHARYLRPIAYYPAINLKTGVL